MEGNFYHGFRSCDWVALRGGHRGSLRVLEPRNHLHQGQCLPPSKRDNCSGDSWRRQSFQWCETRPLCLCQTPTAARLNERSVPPIRTPALPCNWLWSRGYLKSWSSSDDSEGFPTYVPYSMLDWGSYALRIAYYNRPGIVLGGKAERIS